MKRHPYPPTRLKRPTRYWIPLWWCVDCGDLVRRADVNVHGLRPGHALVPAL